MAQWDKQEYPRDETIRAEISLMPDGRYRVDSVDRGSMPTTQRGYIRKYFETLEDAYQAIEKANPGKRVSM